MWCKSCQQDVPGVAATGDASRICCPRCNGTLSSGAAIAWDSPQHRVADPDTGREDPGAESKNDANVGASVSGNIEGANPLAFDFEDWQFEDDARTVKRILRTFDENRHLRFDAASDEPRERSVPATQLPPLHSTANKTARPRQPSSRNPTNRKLTSSKSSSFSWLLMAMGLMTFVCGAVLLVWHFLDAQEHFYRLGLPLTLGGQVALLFGLLVQLESLWQHSRGASATIDLLDQQIDDLRKTTSRMGNANSRAEKSFYVHMAEGASPEVLLADIKGQLDVLAVKIAKQR